MFSKSGLIAIGIAAGVLITLAIGVIMAQNYTYQGSLIEPAIPAADFELTDQNGATFRLSEQRGKIVLIFFGYTHCPDVCPVTLSEYRRIKTGLGDQAKNVRFVFITVDPERDTPELLKTYLKAFDPDFIGLSGSREALEAVWKDYGVYQERREVGSAAGYLIDHTARTYAINALGEWRLTYPFGMETEKIIQDIQHLLKEK